MVQARMHDDKVELAVAEGEILRIRTDTRLRVDLLILGGIDVCDQDAPKSKPAQHVGIGGAAADHQHPIIARDVVRGQQPHQCRTHQQSS
jgi:hypothetical protein